jgi:methyltransferase (TIGR00027 family)
LHLVVALSKLEPAGDLIRRYIDRRWPGSRTSAIARTRFIDDAATMAAVGADQAVILGAGFDARAYRLDALKSLRVFEVDHPSTSAAKRKSVEEALGRAPGHVRFVPVDFERESLAGAMKSAGYDRARRSLFIWEGVTNYLSEAAVDATLRWCAEARDGSVVIFTYVDRRVLESPGEFYGMAALRATLDAAGERWTFGLEPERMSGYLAERGLELEADVAATEYRRRCYGDSAAAMRGYEFYRIAVARVRNAIRA